MSDRLYTTEQERIRKELDNVGACLKDPIGKASPDVANTPNTGQGYCGGPCNQAGPMGGTAWAPDPTQIILDRLHYHQQQIRGLDALYNALPRELPREAANALAQLLLDARPKY